MFLGTFPTSTLCEKSKEKIKERSRNTYGNTSLPLDIKETGVYKYPRFGANKEVFSYNSDSRKIHNTSLQHCGPVIPVH